MKLYFNPFTRGTRPRWLLEELEVPYELAFVDMKAGAHKEAGYLALHPLGKVPVLVDDDGRAIFESAAICLYLADRHLERGLAPAVDSPDRAPYYQWSFYAYVTLEPHVGTYFAQTRTLPQEVRQPKLAEDALAAFRVACVPVEALLAASDWLVGGRFSAADVLMGAILLWAGRMGMLEGFPALRAYVARCEARPAYVRSRA